MGKNKTKHADSRDSPDQTSVTLSLLFMRLKENEPRGEDEVAEAEELVESTLLVRLLTEPSPTSKPLALVDLGVPGVGGVTARLSSTDSAISKASEFVSLKDRERTWSGHAMGSVDLWRRDRGEDAKPCCEDLSP